MSRHPRLHLDPPGGILVTDSAFGTNVKESFVREALFGMKAPKPRGFLLRLGWVGFFRWLNIELAAVVEANTLEGNEAP